MIIRSKFFNKVIIGSIFTLQLTVAGPVYNALAVGSATDKTTVVDFIPSNIEIAKDANKVENGAAYQSKNDLERYYKDINNTKEELKSNEEILEKINLDLTYYQIREEQALQDELNIIKELNEKLSNDVLEISEKIKKLIDKNYDILKKAEEYRKVKEAKDDLEKFYRNLLEDITMML